MNNVATVSALVGLLERNDPDALKELRQAYPDFEFRSDLQLGDGPEQTAGDARVALAMRALTKASDVADGVRTFMQKRLRLYGRLALIGNLLGAGSSIGLFAAAAHDLNSYEMIAAGAAFVGSALALLAQYIATSGHAGISVSEAMTRLIQISREVAEAQGSVEMFIALRSESVDLEAVILKANGAIAELVVLQQMFGVSTLPR